MVEKYYFFGIIKKNDLVAIIDPVIIEDVLARPMPTLFSNELFESSSIFRRGVLFIARSKNKEELLQKGTLLSPNLKRDYYSIYFLKKEKKILFKINKQYYDFKEQKKDFWKLLEPLGMISKKEFNKNFKDYEQYVEETLNFIINSPQGDIGFTVLYNSYIIIKPKKYGEMKKLVTKSFKEQK